MGFHIYTDEGIETHFRLELRGQNNSASKLARRGFRASD